MRVSGTFLAAIGVFFGVIGIIYWFLSYDDGGFLMLIGSCLLGRAARQLLPVVVAPDAAARGRRARRQVGDGAGTIDSFPGSSIWPFLLGMGALFAALTFIFGLWLAPIAIALGLSAVIGGVTESRRGGTV